MKMTQEEKKFFEDLNLDPEDTCVGCGEKFIDLYRDDPYIIEDSQYSNKKDGIICYNCYEADYSSPNGTVLIFDPYKSQINKYIIGEYNDIKMVKNASYNISEEINTHEGFYYEDEEECPIQMKYIRTDAWRGYYVPDIPYGWNNINDDCILHYSESAVNLKKFQDAMIELLWNEGVEFAIVYGRTSNVFATGHDILVNGSLSIEVEEKIKELKEIYR